MTKRLAYQAHTIARLSGYVHTSIHAGPIPTVRLGNLMLRFHDAAATADLARLVLALKKHTDHLTPGILTAKLEDHPTTTLSLIELHGPQLVAGMRRVTPTASRLGHGELSILFGHALRLTITDRTAAERIIDALEHVLGNATLEYPDARSLEEVAAEIKKRWALRISTHGRYA